MAGYWARPDATAEALRGGWFHTGDAGYIDEDGFIFLKDRINDMIVSGGENVYPAEVEAVLMGHPEILECAVIGVPDQKWGETVKAVVVRRAGAALTEAALIEWTREKLAGYKRPRSVDFIDTLPRNAAGKLLKRTLREPYWAGLCAAGELTGVRQAANKLLSYQSFSRAPPLPMGERVGVRGTRPLRTIRVRLITTAQGSRAERYDVGSGE